MDNSLNELESMIENNKAKLVNVIIEPLLDD